MVSTIIVKTNTMAVNRSLLTVSMLCGSSRSLCGK